MIKMMSPLHHQEWIDIRHILFRLYGIVTLCSVVVNFLPNCKTLKKHGNYQQVYEVIILLLSAVALNWRAHLPSLDIPFMGFKAREEDQPIPTVRANWRRRQNLKRLRKQGV